MKRIQDEIGSTSYEILIERNPTAKATIEQLEADCQTLAAGLVELCRQLSCLRDREKLEPDPDNWKEALKGLEPVQAVLVRLGLLTANPGSFQLVYFKPSGKYYTHTFVELPVSHTSDGVPSMFQAVEIIRAQWQTGTLPGLETGKWDGYALLDHIAGYPCLILPPTKD